MNRDKGGMRGHGRFIFTVMAALMLAFTFGVHPSPGAAQTLDDHRAAGVIGEAYDGFVRVRQPGGNAQALADSINAKRRAVYAKRAAEQGATVEQVGQVYAKQIITNAPPGTWFLNQSGTWSRK